MADQPGIVGLTFREAVRFFRAKVRIPTARWTELWGRAHGRAFTVAGAMQDGLLEDFQREITKALEEGTTIADFRKAFDEIVERHGWSYRGRRGWRTRVIFETNLRTSYQAGRWQQMTRVAGRRPYLRYVGILDSRIRPQHRVWHGTVLPMDDPWWESHYPPNGFNCRCTAIQLSARDLSREGWTIADGPPGDELGGVDPGFEYNSGTSGWTAQPPEPL